MRISLLITLLSLLFPWNITSQTEVVKIDTIKLENLVAVLDTVWNTEQGPLRKRDSVRRIHGVDSEGFNYYQAIYKKNHVVNEEKVTYILDTYGWPKKSLIGMQGNWTIANVLQHSSLEVREKYLPMMKQAVEDDQLEARFLVRAEDRIATDKGELQIYGGQMKYYPDTKSFNVWPVYDPANIDERRAKIGLGPIKEFLKQRFDFDWNLEEQTERSKTFQLEQKKSINKKNN
ncbi:DUF6624 domain-containing protein [Flavobacteriaceae sp. LMIT009]